MKIDVVTLSCNDNPLYHDFWYPISKLWKEKFNIHPVLLVYGKVSGLSQKYGDVFEEKKTDDVPDYFPATWGRFWITQKYSNSICMTGDIDMAPLSYSFFTRSVDSLDDSVYTHLNCDAYHKGNKDGWRGENQTLPAYYHVAKGDTYCSVYGFRGWIEEISEIYKEDFPEFARSAEPHLKDADKWCLDELYSTKKLREYEKIGGKVHTEILGMPRLDRSNWIYEDRDIVDGKYRDSHLLRPYMSYRNQIDAVLGLVNGVN